ncbi:uncharacterized protein MONBRDRAFT_13668 [Monosiga brevicollis MX1]|uniref:5-formyltetrahydrofolate cyclo-ligase n=1 Tax=Monosiga brevicollis TaxID=81824 RepID=A9UPV0_MONBE|nr:uncharacterized protein MONBRDRAFT_13668 [Monosiga brevicollis MX1]EDQ92937.1 predicted protein [Monosiga brevicollis MX1]|eukprot:XP_001742699.1 hypothetical protein [Monosiga brevicollis MX1]
MAKQGLRTEMRRVLRAIEPAARARQSAAVCKQVLAHPALEAARNVAVYLSMDDEISTTELIQTLLQRAKQVYVPRYTRETMDMFPIASWADVEAMPLTKWNIRQPAEAPAETAALAHEGLDVILVPGMAFDKAGRRLGRGKGYYDRYFARCAQFATAHNQSRPVYLALAFDEQIVDQVPTDEHDVTLDAVVTPERIY